MKTGLIQEVKQILTTYDAAKADDMVLYLLYVTGRGYGDYLLTILADPRFRAHNGISGFASVSRARRKLQAEYPELKPSPSQVAIRKNLEKEYREFYKKPLCLNCE